MKWVEKAEDQLINLLLHYATLWSSFSLYCQFSNWVTMSDQQSFYHLENTFCLCTGKLEKIAVLLTICHFLDSSFAYNMLLFGVRSPHTVRFQIGSEIADQ